MKRAKLTAALRSAGMLLLAAGIALTPGASPLWAFGRGGGGGGGGHAPSFRGSFGRSYGSYHFPSGRPYSGRGYGNFRAPARDFQNRAITGRAVSVGSHAAMVHATLGNRGLVGNIRSLAARPGDLDGRYHWYSYGGTRFCHWYDRAYGRNWFGFYWGGAFFWSIWWDNYFWWYEPGYARWLWYWDGYWWWYGPGAIPYVYVDDNYYTWQQEANGEELAPAPARQPRAAVAPTFHYSGDGTRLVEVEGAANGAYLYDLTRKDADGTYQLIRYLGDGVSKVQFTNPAYGGQMQIILQVTGSDGNVSRQVLDANGNAIQQASSEEPPPDGNAPNPSQIPTAPQGQTPVPANVKPPAAPSGANAQPLGTSPANGQ